MSHIKYCVCGGIYDITDNIGEYVDIAENDKHKPYFYCSVCNNYEEIKPGTLINIISGSYIIPGVLIHDHIEFEKKLRELCTEHYDSMTSEELKELD